MENNMKVFQKFKNRTTLWSSNLLLGIHLKELKAGPQGDICTIMFIAALFSVTKRWKQPQLSTDRWMYKQNVVYIQRNIIQLLKDSKSWDMLQGWTVRHYGKESDPGTKIQGRSPLLWGPKFTETERKVVVARGCGEMGTKNCCFMGLDFSFVRWKEFWRLGLFNNVNVLNTTELYTLNG